MSLYLLDNSVTQRAPRSPSIADQLLALQSRGDFLAWCEPTRDEALFSARNPADAHRILAIFGNAYVYLPLREAADDLALRIRLSLIDAGLGRAAGGTDVLIAAIAIDHGATVLHYDRDYEIIAGVEPRLDHHWIVPAGSVD